MPCDHHENEQIGEELVKIPDEMAGAEVVHGACTITVRADPDDKNAAAKLQALTDALSLVEQKTHLHRLSPALSGLECSLYRLHGRGCRRPHLRAIPGRPDDGEDSGDPVGKGFSNQGLVLGSAERGVADQAYDKKRMSTLNPNRWWLGESKYQQRKVSAKMTTVVVHEIGHILHEREHRASFWTHKTTWGDEGRPPSTQASKVSQYATKSKLEYVAEVFTGLVMGIHYDQDVIDVYL